MPGVVLDREMAGLDTVEQPTPKLVTLFEYALENDIGLNKVLQMFARKMLPPHVGAVDPERDKTRVHWAVRQGLNYRQVDTCWLVFRRWPLKTPPPPPMRAFTVKEGRPARWWQDPQALSALRERQTAVRELIEAVEKHTAHLLADMRKLESRIYTTRKHIAALHVRQAETDLLCKEALDAVETGNVLMAHAADIDRLRDKLFTPEFLEREMDRRLKERRVQRAREKKFRNLAKQAVESVVETSVEDNGNGIGG